MKNIKGEIIMDKELKELMIEINVGLYEIKALLREQKEQNTPEKIYKEMEYALAKKSLKYGLSRR